MLFGDGGVSWEDIWWSLFGREKGSGGEEDGVQVGVPEELESLLLASAESDWIEFCEDTTESGSKAILLLGRQP